MGNWGYEPKDGDSPLDLWQEVEVGAIKVLNKVFSKKRIDSHRRWDRIGVLQKALEADFFIPPKIIEIAISDCKQMSEDSEFIYSWKRPERVSVVLDELVEAFEQLNLSGGRKTPVGIFELERKTLLPADLIKRINKKSPDEEEDED